MEKASVLDPPVMHSQASASTLEWPIHQKFELGIPMYRQDKEWKGLGVNLSRETTANWLQAVCRDWIQYVVYRLKQKLLKQ